MIVKHYFWNLNYIIDTKLQNFNSAKITSFFVEFLGTLPTCTEKSYPWSIILGVARTRLVAHISK